MKAKFIFILNFLLLTFSVHPGVSQTLLTDDFSYPVMPNIAGMNGWVQGLTWNPSSTIPVISPGLTFTGFAGSGIGNCVLIRNDSALGTCVRKDFTQTSAGNLYMACMLRVDSLTAAANEDFVICLDAAGSTTSMRNLLFVKKYNSSSFFLGVRKTNTTTYSPELYNKNQTYLVVTKYKFITGSTTNDSVSLFVIPGTIPVNEPQPAQVIAAGDDAENLGQIYLNNHAFGQSGNALIKSSVKIDGIRITRSWGEAVFIGINIISTEIPSSFDLSQNYPNPFNPVTNINFSIPKSGYVKLVVYDMMGRVAAELVNGNYSAGTYKVDFDASKLSSGTYFYKINTDEFTLVKKMTLVK
ncbi:MAG: T9SS type A sorting domain-containing protein [Ignavibacteria bacterium]|nr:T9SS type A sorting domain-containing protein [Ignavibacteria bacterium]